MYPAETLLALLRAVRNRLWLQSLLDAASAGLGATAGLLLAAALLHLFTDAAPAADWLLLAALPPAAALLYALLRRRPSLPAAARVADRWFHGEDILTTALPLSRPGSTPGFATEALVVSRANELAARWRSQLPLRRPWHIPSWNLLSLAIAGASLFLLSLPGGHATLPDAVPAATVQSPAGAPSVETPLAGSTFRQQLQQVLHSSGELPDPGPAAGGDLHQGGEPRDGQQHRPGTREGSPGATEPGAAAVATAPATALPTRPATPGSDPAPAGAAGPGDGTSAGGDRASLTGSSAGTLAGAAVAGIPPAPQHAGRTLQISRRDTGSPSGTGGRTTGSELLAGVPDSRTARGPGSTPPAAHRSILPYDTHLDPADRELANQYFKRIDSR